jgi:uncharacterized membrane protein
MATETDERTTHRFEAFSDIVIGLSLAQLGASLTVPKHGSDLFADPTWLFAFIFTFAIICSMWFFHHRLFVSVFVPRTGPILVNFVWLATVVLCVYATQLSVRMPADAVVWRMYYVLFAVSYALLALQYVLGLRLGGSALTPALVARARRQQSFMVLWTVPFVLCALIVFTLPLQFVGAPIGVTFMLAAIASAIMGRHYRKASERLSPSGDAVGRP